MNRLISLGCVSISLKGNGCTFRGKWFCIPSVKGQILSFLDRLLFQRGLIVGRKVETRSHKKYLPSENCRKAAKFIQFA